MDGAVARPQGPARVLGALVGVVAAEASTLLGEPKPVGGETAPVAAAMLDVAEMYAASDGRQVPVDVAARHDGVPGLAWLLPVALVRPDIQRLASDTLELAAAAGVPVHALGACVIFAELSACLLAGWSVPEAVAVTTGIGPRYASSSPALAGEPVTDGLVAALWAIDQQRRPDELLASLAEMATPSVQAAAGGVLGIRDGADQLPASWHARGAETAAKCRELAPRLLRARASKPLRRPTAAVR